MQCDRRKKKEEEEKAKKGGRAGDEKARVIFFFSSSSSSSSISRTRIHLSLVEAHGLPHRRLDVQRADVLPVLLEERDEEVDRHLDVDVELLF